jgi:hypothetical protein
MLNMKVVVNVHAAQTTTSEAKHARFGIMTCSKRKLITPEIPDAATSRSCCGRPTRGNNNYQTARPALVDDTIEQLGTNTNTATTATWQKKDLAISVFFLRNLFLRKTDPTTFQLHACQHETSR